MVNVCGEATKVHADKACFISMSLKLNCILQPGFLSPGERGYLATMQRLFTQLELNEEPSVLVLDDDVCQEKKYYVLYTHRK